MFLHRVIQAEQIEAVEKERFHLFMLEIIPHFIGGLITSVVLYHVFNSHGTDSGLWFLAMTCISGIIVLMYACYFLNPGYLSARQWQQIILFTSSGFGAFLALAPHIFLQHDESQQMSAMVIIVIAMALAPVSVMAYYIEAFYAYITLPLLSISVKIFIDDSNPWILFFIFAFWVMGLIASWRIFRMNIAGIQYKLEVKMAKLTAEQAAIEKSRFLAAASHDIRQPLQAVHLFTSTLLNKYQLQSDPVMQQLQNSVNNMSELLDSLLDISKLDAGVIRPNPKAIRLRDTLKKCVELHKALAEEKGLKLVYNDQDLVAYADPILLNRVISNLLSNAVKYSNSGTITLTAKSDKNQINISVRDQGPGIPADKQGEIFKEFIQLHELASGQPQGLGLGLSIVERLCALQHWHLNLSSSLPCGTCFKITVPRGNNKEVSIAAKNSHSRFSFTGRRILILDDESDIVSSLASLLQEWQFDVRSYQSASDALLTAEQVSWQADIILSDFRLGTSQNGVSFIQQYRQRSNRDVPAILLTGDTTAEKIQLVQASGIPVLYKPVRAAQLRLALQRLLADKPPRAAQEEADANKPIRSA